MTVLKKGLLDEQEKSSTLSDQVLIVMRYPMLYFKITNDDIEVHLITWVSVFFVPENNSWFYFGASSKSKCVIAQFILC